MKKYIFLLFLLFLINIVNSDELKNTTYEGFLWQARYFMNTGDINKAEEILIEMIEIEPLFPDAYFFLYEIYAQQDKLDLALAQLNKLKKINYKNNAISYDVRIFNVDVEIKNLKKKIEDKKKIKLPKKKEKKSLKDKILKKKKEEKKEMENIILAKVIYKGMNKVEIYKGYADNFKIDDSFYLIRGKKNIGRVKIIYVRQFSCDGEIIEFQDTSSLTDGKIITEHIAKVQ